MGVCKYRANLPPKRTRLKQVHGPIQIIRTCLQLARVPFRRDKGADSVALPFGVDDGVDFCDRFVDFLEGSSWKEP